MFGKSGAYLILMTYGWITPFLIIGLYSYPPAHYLSSFYPFGVAVLVTVLTGFWCGRLEKKFGFWSQGGFWPRYFILIGGYWLNIVVILAVTLTLDARGWIGYFGGDAAGSFGMLYIPSAIFYTAAGAIWGFCRNMAKRTRI